jgi:hypothetical protein
MVKDKINYRARGPRTVLTRQTVGGRANDGGLRIGEMERDGVIAHGAAKFLQESMLIRGDEYFMAVCNQTGMIAIYNDSYNLFLSPMVDGPIKFSGTLDSNLNIENISKFGRSFSILRVPYAFKLLIQELQSMNIQMRIITEKNIDQLSSMSFSDNIVKLLGKDANPKMIVQNMSTSTNIQSTKQQTYNKEPPPIYEEEPQENKTKVDETIDETIDETVDPNSLGWYFREYSPDDGDIWGSIILNNTGNESSVWFIEDHDFQVPDTYPAGWIAADAVYKDGTTIPDNLIVEKLKQYREPGNWIKVINMLRKEKDGDEYIPLIENISQQPSFRQPITNPVDSPQYQPTSPVDSPQYQPTSPAYQPTINPVDTPVITTESVKDTNIQDITQEIEKAAKEDDNKIKLLTDVEDPDKDDEEGDTGEKKDKKEITVTNI